MSAMCARYWLRHYKYGLGEDRQSLTVLLKMGFRGQKVVCVSGHLQVKVYDCHSTISNHGWGCCLLFSCQVVSDSLPSRGVQHARLPNPLLSPWVFSNSYPNELVMLCNHLILCHLFLLLPSNFLTIRVFSNESALHIRWPKYWSFSFSISPSNEYSGLIFFRTDWLDLFTVQGTLRRLGIPSELSDHWIPALWDS